MRSFKSLIGPSRRLSKVLSTRCATDTAQAVSLQSSKDFIDKVIEIGETDENLDYYTKPDIDNNTVVFETYYGSSCMLAPINYDILHRKHPQYDASNFNESRYTDCVMSILSERLNELYDDTEQELGYDIKRITLGGLNKDALDNITNDPKYGNADQSVAETKRYVLYKDDMKKFEDSIDLSKMQDRIIDFKSYLENEDDSMFDNLTDDYMIEKIKQSGYEFVIKKINVRNLASVVSLNNEGNYFFDYSNELDFYIENCLANDHLPDYGIFTVLPPSSIFGARLKLVGCAFVHNSNLSIGGIAVDPKFRRKGIATAALYQCAKVMFEKNGFDVVYVHHREGNENATKFFERLGGWQLLDSQHYWLQLGYDANPTID